MRYALQEWEKGSCCSSLVIKPNVGQLGRVCSRRVESWLPSFCNGDIVGAQRLAAAPEFVCYVCTRLCGSACMRGGCRAFKGLRGPARRRTRSTSLQIGGCGPCRSKCCSTGERIHTTCSSSMINCGCAPSNCAMRQRLPASTVTHASPCSPGGRPSLFSCRLSGSVLSCGACPCSASCSQSL